VSAFRASGQGDIQREPIGRRLIGVALVALAAAATTQGGTWREVLRRVVAVDDRSTLAAVAWLDDDTLLLGGGLGVCRYSLQQGFLTCPVPAKPAPEGVHFVATVATDGTVAVAGSPSLGGEQYAWRVSDERRVFARRNFDFTVADLAIFGNQLVVLGFPSQGPGRAGNPAGGAVWWGPVSPDFSKLSPLLLLPEEQIAAFHASQGLYSGHLHLDADGVAVLLTTAPGVYRFRWDGTPLPTLAADLTRLTLGGSVFQLLSGSLGENWVARYQTVLARPYPDDLVRTPEGFAAVVRCGDRKGVHWELWVLNEQGVARTTPLPVATADFAAHLRCQGRAARLACVWSEAANPADRTRKVRTSTNSLVILQWSP